MTARDVIEQIKSLPPEEMSLVANFVREIEAATGSLAEPQTIDRARLKASSERIFDRYNDLFRKLAQ